MSLQETSTTQSEVAIRTEIPSIFDPILISSIIRSHQIARGELGLAELSWSNELQISAESWSAVLSRRNCVLEHFVTSFGQNLYAKYGSLGVSFPSAVNAWIAEKALVNTPGVTFSEIGHYLTIVSASVNRVGCGLSVNNNSNCFVITCNYD